MHPIDKAKSQNNNYIYWHMREVTEDIIKEAIRRKTSIEFDIAFDEEAGNLYIGHPKEFYTVVTKKPLPNNIALEKGVALLKDEKNVLLVLDCKHEKTLPKIKEIINLLGKERCLFHSFIKEFSVPYPDGFKIQAHWPKEDVPFEPVKKLIEETGVKSIAAMHAISKERIEEEKLVERAIEMSKGIFNSLSVYLPDTALPSYESLEKIFQAGFLPWLNQDVIIEKNTLIDISYLGMSDIPERATVNK